MLDLGRTVIMGILNVTPDSFSDGGRFVTLDSALRHAEEMTSAGAQIIDVGGESTRPGAEPVSVEQEMSRVIPVIEVLRREVDSVISIDTSKPAVMEAAVEAGAGFINDVYALRAPGALAVAAHAAVPVCLMHMRGEPRTMQRQPRYRDVVREVTDFLRQRLDACEAAGIARSTLLVDPGFGFGKTLAHNIELLRGLAQLKELGVPIVAGLSRKSMIGQLLGQSLEQRAASSAALALVAVQNGARVIRAHDVAVTRDVIRTWEAVQRA